MARLAFQSKQELDEWYNSRIRTYDDRHKLDRDAFIMTLNAQYLRYSGRLNISACSDQTAVKDTPAQQPNATLPTQPECAIYKDDPATRELLNQLN